MASIIKARTISSVVDNRIQMTNSHFARGFTPPSGWTQLRLAFRFSFSDLGTSAGSTPQFAFGFCSGQTNIFGDATADHFVGWKTVKATWTRNTGVNAYDSTIDCQPFKRIGTTDTNGSGTQLPWYFNYDIANYRDIMFVDLVKGSPNYTLKIYARNAFNQFR